MVSVMAPSAGAAASAAGAASPSAAGAASPSAAGSLLDAAVPPESPQPVIAANAIVPQRIKLISFFFIIPFPFLPVCAGKNDVLIFQMKIHLFTIIKIRVLPLKNKKRSNRDKFLSPHCFDAF
jgi:hypothetical protein